jgi:hypothetical protein
MNMILRLLATLPVIVVTACSPATDSAPATPGKGVFPDMADYVDMSEDRAVYRSEGKSIGWDFRVSDDTVCTLNLFGGPDTYSADCTGPRPDVGPGSWTATVFHGKKALVSISSMGDERDGDRVATLPAGHLVQKGDFVCGAGDDYLVACRIGDHGFVLTAAETKLF